MIHLFSPAPALDLEAVVRPPVSGKIGALGRWSFSPGGKAVNLARFLRAWKMSGRLTLGCGGGADPSHVLYAALLRREGLRASYVDLLAPIRLNLVTHQPECSSKYNHSGFPLSSKSLAAYERATLARLKRGDIWVLAGRVPRGRSPRASPPGSNGWNVRVSDAWWIPRDSRSRPFSRRPRPSSR